MAITINPGFCMLSAMVWHKPVNEVNVAIPAQSRTSIGLIRGPQPMSSAVTPAKPRIECRIQVSDPDIS